MNNTFPDMNCRKCNRLNPWVYFAPVAVAPFPATCICIDCAIARGWADSQGNLKAGVTL